MVTPRRCLKCQHFGHYASECKATTDTCALCTLNHCTNLCPTPDSPPKCANCTGVSAVRHGSADKDCPSFLSETCKLHRCNPKSKYKFFPTSDPSTWKLTSEPDPAPVHAPSLPTYHQTFTGYTPRVNSYCPDYTDYGNQYNAGMTYHDPLPDAGWQEVRQQCNSRHPPLRGRLYKSNLSSANTNPRYRDTGWPVRPVQSSLDMHFNNPSSHDRTHVQPTSTSSSTPKQNGLISTNLTTTTTTAARSTDQAHTVRWSDKNFEDLVASLPPLNPPGGHSPPALEYAWTPTTMWGLPQPTNTATKCQQITIQPTRLTR